MGFSVLLLLYFVGSLSVHGSATTPVSISFIQLRTLTRQTFKKLEYCCILVLIIHRRQRNILAFFLQQPLLTLITGAHRWSFLTQILFSHHQIHDHK